MKLLLIFNLFSLLILSLSNCTNSLTDGSSADSAKVEWQLVTNVSDTGARVNWKCSGKVMGFLITNGPNYNRLDTSFIAGELHSIGLDNLVSNQTYNYVQLAVLPKLVLDCLRHSLLSRTEMLFIKEVFG